MIQCILTCCTLKGNTQKVIFLLKAKENALVHCEFDDEYLFSDQKREFTNSLCPMKEMALWRPHSLMVLLQTFGMFHSRLWVGLVGRCP